MGFRKTGFISDSESGRPKLRERLAFAYNTMLCTLGSMLRGDASRQFFDHYLKDAPATDWMENGVPLAKKAK